MEGILYTYEPMHEQDQATFWIALVLACVALGSMVWLLKGKALISNRNYRLLTTMLLFFVFLIAGSTAFFSQLFMYKVGPVNITESSITTPYGKVAFEDILNASIQVDKQPSIINPNITRKSTRLLIIEEKDGGTHVLPEENYPIQEILGRMKELIRPEKDQE